MEYFDDLFLEIKEYISTKQIILLNFGLFCGNSIEI